MWEVFSRQDGHLILYRSSKDTYGWGNFCSGVRSVPVLEDGFLECIDVDCAYFPGVAGNQPLDGFDTYFSSAVAVRERHRAETVVYPQLCRNYLVVWATNSRPPSDESSFGMP